jgi:hypothetical protein
MLICYWKQNECRQPATELIISGCLNQHIHEIPLCANHAGTWAKNCKQGMLCKLCYTQIDKKAWIMIQTYRLRTGYQQPSALNPIIYP